jgi:hypothetical protein
LSVTRDVPKLLVCLSNKLFGRSLIMSALGERVPLPEALTVNLEPFVEYTPWAHWLKAIAVDHRPADDPEVLSLWKSKIIEFHRSIALVI